jgi:lysophospholipase L1-like esterase
LHRLLSSCLAAAAAGLAITACAASGSTSVHAPGPGTSHSSQSTPPVSTPPASASAPAGAEGKPDYLALGDSIAFGYRPAAVTPPASYLNAANFTGYPDDIARARRLHLVNASCPGETTSSMISKSARSNGCESGPSGGPGYRTFAPLHVVYSGSQLAFAVRYLRQHPATRLVTLDIGANDLFLCEDNADHCAGPDFRATLATISKNVNSILSALRHQAGYRGTLVVMNYYALTYGDTTSLTSIGAQALNTTLASSAARYGGRIASAFAAFKTASADRGGDTCAAGLRIKLPSGGCDLHPSARGHEVLAKVIDRVAAAG